MKDKTYHLIGIGGIGMSALARLLRQKGCKVVGTDQKDSTLTQLLQNEGINVQIGHDEKHVSSEATIIYSSAIQSENPEIKKAKKLNLPTLHRSQLLSQLMQGQKALLVSGTHGKTTTSALLAWVLHYAKTKPSFALGGILSSLQTNGSFGKGSHFVAEADESDGSFIKHPCHGAILTNLEEEHLDFWKTRNALFSAFERFIEQVENPSLFFWCYDDQNLRSLNPKGISYGFSPRAHIQVTNVRERHFQVLFDINLQGKVIKDIVVSTLGKFNALNASAVFAMACKLGIDPEVIRKGLSTFPGVHRRFDRKGEARGAVMYDDYAHHPTEIHATLSALKTQIPDRRLIAVFQPHRYSRTKDCYEEFCTCFNAADEVVITDVYTAGEAPIDGITAQNLAKEIGHSSVYYISKESLIEQVAEKMRPHDVVITLGAGDITDLGAEILNRYAKSNQRWVLGLVYGGKSTEHEIAIRSADFIRKALSPEYYDVREFYVNQDGGWGKSDEFSSTDLRNLQECDVCFPVLHGPFGEDGMIQGFFETLHIPYVGCDYHASVLAMNKDWAKQVALQQGIKTAKFAVLHPGDDVHQAISKLTFPLWVKAVHLGSSIGVYRVKNLDELIEKVRLAFTYDERLILEEEVQGKQIEFSMLGNKNIEVAEPAEILSFGKFHDFDSKYSNHAAKTDIPPKISDEKIEEGKQLAKKIYQACGCSGFTRIDTFLDEQGVYWFNELNPIPGMTPTSPFPDMWEKSGVLGPELVDRLVVLAFEKHRRQAKRRSRR